MEPLVDVTGTAAFWHLDLLDCRYKNFHEGEQAAVHRAQTAAHSAAVEAHFLMCADAVSIWSWQHSCTCAQQLQLCRRCVTVSRTWRSLKDGGGSDLCSVMSAAACSAEIHTGMSKTQRAASLRPQDHRNHGNVCVWGGHRQVSSTGVNH